MAPGILESSSTPVIDNNSTKATVNKYGFPQDADCEEYARSLDESDPLRGFRDKFIIPSKAGLERKSLAVTPGQSQSTPPVFSLSRGVKELACGGPWRNVNPYPSLPFLHTT